MSTNGSNYPMYNYSSMAQQATFYGQGFVPPSNASIVPHTVVPPSYPMYPNQTNSYDHIIRSAAETLAAFTRPSENQTRRPMNKSTTTNSTQMFYCEICRIACGGQATYQSHLNGSKHKKKEINAQTSQNSTVNTYRCELCDITCTSVDAYKAHLEGSKHEKAMKLHRKLGKMIPDVELPLNNSTTTSPQEEKLSNESSTKLIGEEYIETTYDESRKPIIFHCKLCDCKFNDANAKDAHLKGKRHRISYRKKVDPNFQVEQNISTTKKSSNPKQKTTDVIEENLSSTNEIDDDTRCLMKLHEQIIPSPHFLNLLEQFVSAIESALKISSDELRLSSSSTTTLLGVSRIGLFAKSLLIKTDRIVQLVVMCSDWPTFDLIEKLLTIFRKNFSEMWRNRIEIHWRKPNEEIQIETTDDDGTKVIGSIYLTSTIVETSNENECSTTNGFFSKTICLNSLKAIQSVRWFQSQVTIRQHASALIRCFRYKSFPSDIIEILIEFALSKRTSAVAAFRFVLEMIAGGILFENDFLHQQSLSIEQRNEMTNEAQFALRLMSFGQLNRWFEQNMTSAGKRSHSDNQCENSIKRQCFHSTENDELHQH